MNRIVFDDYQGPFIKKDDVCYFYTGETFENISDIEPVEVFGSCGECSISNESSSSSQSESSSSNVLNGLFRTESQGTITPQISVSDASTSAALGPVYVNTPVELL